ncbi:MAG: hypothetical protein Tsb0010_03890 [Parvularculaceae bacterium]
MLKFGMLAMAGAMGYVLAASQTGGAAEAPVYSAEIAAPAPVSFQDSAGGAAFGEPIGGVTDRAFVYGPPNWSFSVVRSSGAFLDCGDAIEAAALDRFGQATLPMDCGVTLTETVSIPQVGAKARLTIHY